MPKRVAIIGAGPSGLPCIRHALLYGFEPICFEVSGQVGGLWNYNPDSGEGTSVMRSTVMNTAKEMCAYSDFPPDSTEANFMRHERMLKYLNDYADHYKLRKHIRFHHKIIDIRRSDSFDDDGSWMVRFSHGNSVEEEVFALVLLCTGHHQMPLLPPAWPGQNEFGGTILHAKRFRTPEVFRDQRVVVVGGGNSGLDIAVETSRVAKSVFLSSRRGVWILNRVNSNGTPNDMITETRGVRFIFKLLPRRLRQSVVKWICSLQFNHDVYGLKPDFDMFSSHPSVNDEIHHRILCGAVDTVGEIMDFRGNSVRFKNGREEEVDTVILCTGYRIAFPLLESGNLIRIEGNRPRLWKNAFLPSLRHQTLALIGLIQPTGTINAIAEMQARVFFAQIRGDCRLPNRENMEREIRIYEEELKREYVASARHTIQVDSIQYLDSMASLIGALPDPLRLFPSDPLLAFKIVWQANVAYNYRLIGPNSWPGAREAILQMNSRIELRKGTNDEKNGWIVRSLAAILIFLTFTLIGAI